MPGRRSPERCCRLVVRTWRRIEHSGTARGIRSSKQATPPDIQPQNHISPQTNEITYRTPASQSALLGIMLYPSTDVIKQSGIQQTIQL